MSVLRLRRRKKENVGVGGKLAIFNCYIIICQNLRVLCLPTQCAVHCCWSRRALQGVGGQQVCTCMHLCAAYHLQALFGHLSPIRIGTISLLYTLNPSHLLLSWCLSGLKSFPSKCALVFPHILCPRPCSR